MRDVGVVIGEILLAIEDARTACVGLTFDQYPNARIQRLAAERAIEIISEAARHLPDALTARHAAIPWPRIKAVGNVLRHEYYRVAPQVIWDVVHHHLPALEAASVEQANSV
jgi:uncharacterized protein with HEPN domain